MDLLLKIGNSTSVLIKDKRRLEVPTEKLFKLSGVKKILGRSRAQRLFILSVVPSAERIFRKLVGKNFQEVISISRKHLGISSRYSASIGIDRLFNIFSVLRAHRTNRSFVVIDLGTAITVDFFDQTKNLHLGGWILGGLDLMSESLYQKTAQLPLVRWSKKNAGKIQIARGTQGALLFGQMAFLQGLLESAQNMARRELRTRKFDIYITGGKSLVLTKFLRENRKFLPSRIQIDSSLSIRGLDIFRLEWSRGPHAKTLVRRSQR